MLPIPRRVRKNASRGNRMKEEGYRGARGKGISRGIQLENESHISIEDAIQMRAWFARHVITSYGNYEQWTEASDDDKEDRRAWKGAVAWLLWGGTAAYYWILSKDVQTEIYEWGIETNRRLKKYVTPYTGLVD